MSVTHTKCPPSTHNLTHNHTHNHSPAIARTPWVHPERERGRTGVVVRPGMELHVYMCMLLKVLSLSVGAAPRPSHVLLVGTGAVLGHEVVLRRVPPRLPAARVRGPVHNFTVTFLFLSRVLGGHGLRLVPARSSGRRRSALRRLVLLVGGRTAIVVSLLLVAGLLLASLNAFQLVDSLGNEWVREGLVRRQSLVSLPLDAFLHEASNAQRELTSIKSTKSSSLH